jgi:hypothetical protein
MLLSMLLEHEKTLSAIQDRLKRLEGQGVEGLETENLRS